MSSSWEMAGSAKRRAILGAIPEEWRLREPLPPAGEYPDITGTFPHRYLIDAEIAITEMDVKDLAGATTTGKFSAEEVVKAFSHRAALAHQMTNCLHEYFYDAALADEKKLDEYFRIHGKPLGPLHGIPGQKNSPKYKNFESVIVTALRNAGAILYVKTSVPHTVLIGETVNNIIEYTWNPCNRLISAGGSSGGEGALVALKGSLPSHGRLPYQGMAISIDGQTTIPSVVGPMAASVSGLGLVTKALLQEEPWLYDPNVLELPWRASQYDAMAKIIADANVGHGRLAFGIIEHDGVVAPHPPVKRALRIVTNTLEKLGHQIIRWTPSSHELGVRLALTAWIYDGGVDVHHHMGLAHEPIPDVLARTYGTKPLRQFNASEIHRNNVLLREWRKAYLDYWSSTSNLTGTGRPVDAVICPVAPFCAVRPTKYHYYGYSVWPNATDYTAGSFPVTLANKRVDTKDESYQPINDIDRKVYDDYDAEIYDKSPAGLQLVARRFEEEKMLALLEYVGELFKA
ncbi:amidase [Fusarium oxysporum f. sp. phaseoli]